MPDLRLESNEEWEALWALLDSCSSVDVVDMDKVFPGAQVKKPKGKPQQFAAANRSNVENMCTATIPARTMEGGDRTTEWNNAMVEMPILSTKPRAEGGKKVCGITRAADPLAIHTEA